MSADLMAAELLEKGAAYIEEHGLWQGRVWPTLEHHQWEEAQRQGLPVCVIGSLVVVGQGDYPPEVTDALSDHLQDGVVSWSDSPGRTATEVADTMRACATNLRATS